MTHYNYLKTVYFYFQSCSRERRTSPYLKDDYPGNLSQFEIILCVFMLIIFAEHKSHILQKPVMLTSTVLI